MIAFPQIQQLFYVTEVNGNIATDLISFSEVGNSDSQHTSIFKKF